MLLRTNFTLRTPYATFNNCHIETQVYGAGHTALRIVDAEGPVATATVWLPELKSDEVAIKDYSENVGVYDSLLNAGVIKPAHRYLHSGHVERIPVCRLSD